MRTLIFLISVIVAMTPFANADIGKDNYPIRAELNEECVEFLMNFNTSTTQLSEAALTAKTYSEQTEYFILETYASKISESINTILMLLALERLHAREGHYSKTVIRTIRKQISLERSILNEQLLMIKRTHEEQKGLFKEKQELIKSAEQANMILEKIDKELSHHTWE
jgi:hypothetical protein